MSRIHTACIGEDSSILGSLKFLVIVIPIIFLPISLEFDGKFIEANIPNIEVLGHTIHAPKIKQFAPWWLGNDPFLLGPPAYFQGLCLL